MPYAFVLGAVYALGMHGPLLHFFAVAFSVACFAASTALTCLLGARLLNRTAGVLVAGSGPLAWGAANDMEAGLVMLLVTGTLLALVIEHPTGRFRWTPLVAELLALARTEGLIFAAALSCAALWTLWTPARSAGLRTRLGRSLWVLLPLAIGAGQFLFYRLATGTSAANGVQLKSLLYDRPVFYFGEFLDRTTATVRSLLGTFSASPRRTSSFPVRCCSFAPESATCSGSDPGGRWP